MSRFANARSARAFFGPLLPTFVLRRLQRPEEIVHRQLTAARRITAMRRGASFTSGETLRFDYHRRVIRDRSRARRRKRGW